MTRFLKIQAQALATAVAACVLFAMAMGWVTLTADQLTKGGAAYAAVMIVVRQFLSIDEPQI